MKIIFIRHGQDDERYRGGWSDRALTDEGILQAQKLGEYLNQNREIYNISHIVTSDLRRAVTTAEIISKELNIPVKKDFSLREINNGDLSGMLNTEAEIRYPGLYFRSLGMDEKYPNGESPKEFFERVKAWFEVFISENQTDKENILVVTHGGVINIIYHIVKDIKWNNKNKPFSIPNCSVHILDLERWQKLMKCPLVLLDSNSPLEEMFNSASKYIMLGKTVTVTVDRPLGSRHPKHSDMIYPVNYGYVEGFIAGDGEEQDAYILGIETPLESFTGDIIAIIHRRNDNEDKWVVAPHYEKFTKDEIIKAIEFQEKYFDSEIIT